MSDRLRANAQAFAEAAGRHTHPLIRLLILLIIVAAIVAVIVALVRRRQHS
jgi:hypothetical protein